MMILHDLIYFSAAKHAGKYAENMQNKGKTQTASLKNKIPYRFDQLFSLKNLM